MTGLPKPNFSAIPSIFFAPPRFSFVYLPRPWDFAFRQRGSYFCPPKPVVWGRGLNELPKFEELQQKKVLVHPLYRITRLFFSSHKTPPQGLSQCPVRETHPTAGVKQIF